MALVRLKIFEIEYFKALKVKFFTDEIKSSFNTGFFISLDDKI